MHPPALFPITAVTRITVDLKTYYVSGAGHFLDVRCAADARLPLNTSQQRLYRVFQKGEHISSIVAMNHDVVLVLTRCLKAAVLPMSRVWSPREVGLPCRMVVDFAAAEPKLARAQIPLNRRWIRDKYARDWGVKISGTKVIRGEVRVRDKALAIMEPVVELRSALSAKQLGSGTRVPCIACTSNCEKCFAFYEEGSNVAIAMQCEYDEPTRLRFQQPEGEKIDGWDMLMVEDVLLIASKDFLFYFNCLKRKFMCRVRIRSERQAAGDEGDYKPVRVILKEKDRVFVAVDEWLQVWSITGLDKRGKYGSGLSLEKIEHLSIGRIHSMVLQKGELIVGGQCGGLSVLQLEDLLRVKKDHTVVPLPGNTDQIQILGNGRNFCYVENRVLRIQGERLERDFDLMKGVVEILDHNRSTGRIAFTKTDGKMYDAPLYANRDLKEKHTIAVTATASSSSTTCLPVGLGTARTRLVGWSRPDGTVGFSSPDRQLDCEGKLDRPLVVCEDVGKGFRTVATLIEEPRMRLKFPVMAFGTSLGFPKHQHSSELSFEPLFETGMTDTITDTKYSPPSDMSIVGLLTNAARREIHVLLKRATLITYKYKFVATENREFAVSFERRSLRQCPFFDRAQELRWGPSRGILDKPILVTGVKPSIDFDGNEGTAVLVWDIGADRVVFTSLVNDCDPRCLDERKFGYQVIEYVDEKKQNVAKLVASPTGSLQIDITSRTMEEVITGCLVHHRIEELVAEDVNMGAYSMIAAVGPVVSILIYEPLFERMTRVNQHKWSTGGYECPKFALVQEEQRPPKKAKIQYATLVLKCNEGIEFLQMYFHPDGNRRPAATVYRTMQTLFSEYDLIPKPKGQWKVNVDVPNTRDREMNAVQVNLLLRDSELNFDGTTRFFHLIIIAVLPREEKKRSAVIEGHCEFDLGAVEVGVDGEGKQKRAVNDWRSCPLLMGSFDPRMVHLEDRSNITGDGPERMCFIDLMKEEGTMKVFVSNNAATTQCDTRHFENTSPQYTATLIKSGMIAFSQMGKEAPDPPELFVTEKPWQIRQNDSLARKPQLLSFYQQTYRFTSDVDGRKEELFVDNLARLHEAFAAKATLLARDTGIAYGRDAMLHVFKLCSCCDELRENK